MSYARFSDDNHASDVYAYEDADGEFVVMVAGRRMDPAVQDKLPQIDDLPREGSEEEIYSWAEKAKAVLDDRYEMIKSAPYVPIDHDNAGSSFRYYTRTALLDYLLWLREEGFHIPEGTIARLRREISDEDGS